MKNSDTPAMPQDANLYCHLIGACPTEATGLTKREYFAARAMQSLIMVAEKRGWHTHNKDACIETIGKKAVLIAESVLESLEFNDE